LSVWGYTVMAQNEKTLHASANVTQELPLLGVKRLSWDWGQAPVYQLTNFTGIPLAHVTVYSWTDLLPILWIGGAHDKVSPANIMEFEKPPFELDAHQVLWFIGPIEGPGKFQINWLNIDGLAQYEEIDI
jgi:hypothetical protein